MAFKFVLVCALAALASADVSHITSYGYGVGPTTSNTQTVTHHVGGGGLGGSIISGAGLGGGYKTAGTTHGFSSISSGSSGSGSFGGGSYSTGGSYGGSHGSSSGVAGFVDAGPIFHTFNAADVGVAYSGRSASGGVSEQFHGGAGEAIINKNFYTYSGPEDHSEHAQVHHVNIGRPEKNLKVIFVKNPSSSSNRALIKAHYAPSEEKTVVYVLSKNDNNLQVDTEIDEVAPTAPVKPDVVFVKYKNNEEIGLLQEEVRRKLEHIGGQVHVTDEGAAIVRSITQDVDGGHGAGGVIGIGGGSGSSGVYTTGGSGYSGNTYTSGSGFGSGGHGGSTYTTSTHTSGGSGFAPGLVVAGSAKIPVSSSGYLPPSY